MIEMFRENLGEIKNIIKEQGVGLELPKTVAIRKEGKYFAIPVIDKRGKEQEVLVYKTENEEEQLYLVIYDVVAKQGTSSKAVSFRVKKGNKDIEVLKEIVKDILKDCEIKEILSSVNKEDKKKLSRLILFKEYDKWKEDIEKGVEEYIEENKIGLAWEVVKEEKKKKKQNEIIINIDTKVFIGKTKVMRKGEEVKAFRILNTKLFEVKDLTKEDIKISNIKFENIEYNFERDKIVGVNGVMSRYGVVGGKDKIVVLAEIKRKSRLFYLIATNNTTNKKGTYIVKEQELVEMGKRYGIANGKIVKVEETGKEHISSIKGNYIRLEL